MAEVLVSHPLSLVRLSVVRRVVVITLVAVVLFVLPSYLEQRQVLGVGLPQLNLALVAVMGAVALNLLVGRTGLISLGHAAFFAVGAITGAVLGGQIALPFPIVLAGAMAAGAVVGTVVGLPSLRLRGLFLMLATLALHFIVLYLFTQYMLDNFGPTGIFYDVPAIGNFVIDSERRWYFLLLTAVVITIAVTHNLVRGRHGRAFLAVRDHDIAAASIGINVARTRLVAFAVSSSIVTVAGVLYAYYLGLMSNEAFDLTLVVGYFAMIIIGGMSRISGAVAGAIVWQFLPQLVETASLQLAGSSPGLSEALARYQGQVVSIILGILVLLVLRYRPDGLVGIWTSIRRSARNWPYSD